jgi:signal transduction histidine kinase
VLARGIAVLVRFARLVSDAAASSEILPLLADSLSEHVEAGGVAVVAIDPHSTHGRASVVAAHGLPEEVAELDLDADAIGMELGEAILRAAKGRFATEQTRPLVAAGSLFGAVVLLFEEDRTPTEDGMSLAEALVDLAAITLASAAQVEKLEKSYADLRASQDILARTQKLRALGQMAAGVSHDLKNILNPLALHLQVMDRSLARGDVSDVRESIGEMKQVVVRGVQTLERLRDYSRQQKETKTELVEIDRLAREAAGIAKPRMATAARGAAISVREELSAPPAVMAISGEVVSALVNLIVNAIDAIGAGGAAGTITLRSGASDGGSWIEIADDGPGMPLDVQKRVYEPFFTTKGAEGTGLGLANVYATVQRHGGSITLDTAPGKGTCFRLWLPGAAGPGRLSQAPKGEPGT